jgi:hypothetical protein
MTERRDAQGPPPGAPPSPAAPRAESEAERAVVSGEGPAEADVAPPPRPRSAFLARNPIFAALAIAACAYVAWELAPDVAYYFSSEVPIDLGGPGAYRLSEARPNRLARVAGAPAAELPVSTSRGDARRVVALAGAPLVVDRSAAAGAASAFEGRVLPEREAREYAPIVAALRERGLSAAGPVTVLREGERPRRRWTRPVLALAVLLLGALNLRALALHFTDSR